MEATVQPPKRFICSFSGCAAAYNKQWKLDAHLCAHTGVRPHACAHPGCAKTFCSTYHLARHGLSHSGARPFRCAAAGCDQAFTTNSNLRRHVGRVHDADGGGGGGSSEPRAYACTHPGCGLRFRKHKQLRSHLCERHAQQPPPYRCPHPGCQMGFSFPSRLRRHEKVHRGYPCAEDGCGFTARTWTESLRHRKRQHRPALRCDRCPKEFRDAWFLRQHRQVHSDARLVLRCPVAGCGRSYTTGFNLQSHVGSFHRELRPFACPEPGCRKTFAMMQSLRRHGVVHDPQRRKLERKPRPKRSLASRLSGYGEAPGPPGAGSGEAQGPPGAGSVELVSLLQDATLLCHPAAVDAQELGQSLSAPPLTV